MEFALCRAMYSCTLCTCQCKFGTRVTFPLVVAVSSSAVLDDLGALRGGSPDGSLGLSVGHTRLRGGAPLGSLGLSCPDSLSEGLPVIPHGRATVCWALLRVLSACRLLRVPFLRPPSRGSASLVPPSVLSGCWLLRCHCLRPPSRVVYLPQPWLLVACASALPRASGSCSAWSGARGFVEVAA